MVRTYFLITDFQTPLSLVTAAHSRDANEGWPTDEESRIVADYCLSKTYAPRKSLESVLMVEPRRAVKSKLFQ